MYNDINITEILTFNDINTTIAFYSAIVALLSLFVTLYSSYQTKQENRNNRKYTFKENFTKKLDECYIILSEYIQEYTLSKTSKKKTIARDNIMYRLESLRVDLFSYSLISEDIMNFYGDVTMKISDITYENKFEKNIRDLGLIKNNITILKNKIETL